MSNKKKKVALIIFPLHDSHGCILQTFALKERLKDLSESADVIDIQWQIKPSDRWRRTIKNSLKKILRRYKGKINYDGVVHPNKMELLNLFIDEYLRKNLISIYNDRSLKKIAWNQYDAVVVGSDQTWRPQYVPNIFHYYLDFLPINFNGKRVSYAASFGTDEWEYDSVQETICKELISRFDGVSVREDSGVNLCRNHFGKESVSVLDPTLLFNGSYYIERLKLQQTCKDFVAAYWLDITPGKNSIADYLSKLFDLPVIEVNQIKESKAKDNIQPTVSIETWLQKSLSARFVVVDSFHAMVFAILFHKNFLVLGNKERGLSRFESLLDKLSLSDRLVTSSSDISEKLIYKEIDWNEIERKLQELRNNSLVFLKEAVGC